MTSCFLVEEGTGVQHSCFKMNKPRAQFIPSDIKVQSSWSHLNKDEVDHMTLTQGDIPSAVSPEMSILLLGLLEKDITKRLGCIGRGYATLSSYIM